MRTDRTGCKQGRKGGVVQRLERARSICAKFLFIKSTIKSIINMQASVFVCRLGKRGSEGRGWLFANRRFFRFCL